MRVAGQRGDQIGMARVDLLAREPSLLVHQVDEAEVA